MPQGQVNQWSECSGSGPGYQAPRVAGSNECQGKDNGGEAPTIVSCFGFGAHGQCGGGASTPNAPPITSGSLEKNVVPRHIDVVQHAAQVACGHLHTLVLTRAGEVWSFGCNEYGQLGYASTTRAGPVAPKQILFFRDKRVQAVAAGGFISAVLTGIGEVYSFGRYHNQRKPKAVSGLNSDTVFNPVVQISCGVDHAACVKAGGELFSYGRNISHQLGYPSLRGHDELFDLTAARVEGDLRSQRVTQVACGDAFTAALTEDGEVYSWGDCAAGKTGHLNWGQHEMFALMSMLSAQRGPAGGAVAAAAAEPPVQKGPRHVASLGKQGIVQIDCGSHHMAALSRDGVVYTCGSGVNGRLGHSSMDTLRTPVPIESLRGLGRVRRISSGDSHNVALMDSGEIFSWGYSCYGQLGIDMEGLRSDLYVSTPQPVTAMAGMDVIDLSCGGGHTVVVCRPVPVTLKLLCERSIQTVMSPEDACTVIQYAELHEARGLWRNACLTVAMHFPRMKDTEEYAALSAEARAEVERLLPASRARRFTI